MTKIKIKWLWIVVGLEVAVIAGLFVWALAFREADQPKVQTPKTQNTTPSLKTPKIELFQVANGLIEPVAITAMPSASDKRLFVVEQDGTIRIIGADKKLDPAPFLDIKSKVQSSGEMGLLGLAFHPKVAENNFFYVNYVDKSSNTVVARYTISQTTGRADPGSEKLILKIRQPYSNHNGGALVFGPDKYLYIGMGDGGSAGDPENRAQSMNDLLGKMLRINVDSGNPYAIPGDNPFVEEGGKPEIWAYGLRNPWRFSFDRKTGDMYIADVGQGSYEEISRQPATSKGGDNYGWRCHEGLHEYNIAGCQSADNYVKPIIEYGHTEGRCSVTGGYVYRGSKYPALAGKYFYGDFCGGQLYYTQQKDSQWEVMAALDTLYQITTFGEDSAGELYTADYATGTVYQVTDTAN